MKKVRISVNGAQYNPEHCCNEVELLTDGQYSHTGGVSEITYAESELTGMEGYSTTFRINAQGVVTLERKGKINSTMVFERGKKQVILYDTPHGAATLGVKTIKATSLFGKRGGELELEYALDAGNLRVGVNSFKIKVQPL